MFLPDCLKDLREGCGGRRGAGEESEGKDGSLARRQHQSFYNGLDLRDVEHDGRRAGMDRDVRCCAEGAVGVDEAVRVAVRGLDYAQNEYKRDA